MNNIVSAIASATTSIADNNEQDFGSLLDEILAMFMEVNARVADAKALQVCLLVSITKQCKW